MATNQVIHGSNRVVENPNRYKLNAVSGQANTYDLEKVPGLITDNGTPYNKIVLDKIDNVLSYLTPSVEKYTDITIPYQHKTTNLLPTSNWIKYNRDNYTNKCLDATQTNITINGIPYTYSDEYNVSLMSDGNINTYYKSAISDNVVTISFENPIKINKIKIKVSCPNNTVLLQYKNSASVWTDLLTISEQSTLSELTISSPNYYTEYRLFRTGYQSSDYYAMTIYEFQISDWEIAEVSTSLNKFTLGNNGNTFINNQRLLIETPSTLDLTGVESNTINDVSCDTLLQPSTKYELIYNESEDKFDVNDGVLYDITLKEAVNQVDLTGINNRIKIGSIYRVIAIGKALGGNGNLVIGNAPSTVITTILTYTAVEFYKTNEGGIVVGIPHTGGAVQGTFIDNESISISNSRQFDEGARIIIKEVA